MPGNRGNSKSLKEAIKHSGIHLYWEVLPKLFVKLQVVGPQPASRIGSSAPQLLLPPPAAAQTVSTVTSPQHGPFGFGGHGAFQGQPVFSEEMMISAMTIAATASAEATAKAVVATTGSARPAATATYNNCTIGGADPASQSSQNQNKEILNRLDRLQGDVSYIRSHTTGRDITTPPSPSSVTSPPRQGDKPTASSEAGSGGKADRNQNADNGLVVPGSFDPSKQKYVAQ